MESERPNDHHKAEEKPMNDQQNESEERPKMSDQQHETNGDRKNNRVSFEADVTVQVMVVNDANIPVETKNIRVPMSVFSEDETTAPPPSTDTMTTSTIDPSEQPKQPTRRRIPPREPPKSPPPQAISPPTEDPPALTTLASQQQQPLSSQQQQPLVISPPTEDPPALTTLASQQKQPPPSQQPIEIVIPAKSLQQEITEAAENLVTKGLLVAVSRRYPGALQGTFHPLLIYIPTFFTTPSPLPHLSSFPHICLSLPLSIVFPFSLTLTGHRTIPERRRGAP